MKGGCVCTVNKRTEVKNEAHQQLLGSRAHTPPNYWSTVVLQLQTIFIFFLKLKFMVADSSFCPQQPELLFFPGSISSDPKHGHTDETQKRWRPSPRRSAHHRHNNYDLGQARSLFNNSCRLFRILFLI